jgi:nicotinamide-nucleotide amidase
MKKASIISIGNELLSGQTIDTNAPYLKRKLLKCGIPTVSSFTVGDSEEAIVRALRLSAEEADFIIVTGGLGPTDDDLTRQAFADFLGDELVCDGEQLGKIEDYFKSRGYKMLENNKIQAMIPKSAEAIDNDRGTAPGILANYQGKILAALPGVPSEMKKMFKVSVLPLLKTSSGGQYIVTKRLKCFGTGESNIAEMLGGLMDRNRNPLINITVEFGVITLYIIATAEDENTAREMVEAESKVLTEKLGDYLFGYDDETLAGVVGKKLTDQKKTVATAESCTGGLVAKLLTDPAGASEYFKQGWVTYSNESKTEQLGVDAELIEKNGAVSEEVAAEMAKGAMERASADFAIAITGIAGPGGGSENKPVGLVYISIASPHKQITKRFVFLHERGFVRLRTAKTALNILRTQFLI